MELEKNILVLGEKEKINSIIDDIQKNINLSYKLSVTIINSLKELFSILISNEKIDLLCIVDNLGNIKQEEIVLNIYQSSNLRKPYIIFLNSINNSEKLNSILISNNSIYNQNHKAEFINEKLEFYSNIERHFSESYFSGTTSDFNLYELFLIIEKLKRIGILNIKSNNNNNFYFDFYFKDGNLVSAYGSNGFIPLTKIDAIKEFFKENVYKNSNFEFLADVNVPEIHFNKKTSEIISDIYKSFKLTNEGIRSSTFVSYENLKKTIIIDKKNKYQENLRKTIIIDKNKNNFILKKGGKKMINYDLSKAIEIAEDVYWVSERDPKTLLQLNSYLRVFRKDSKVVSLLIDPGPLEYFPVISRKVSSIIKDISKVSMYSINHQDPDVGTNSTFLAKMNPKSVCLCTEDTWRLVRFYEIPKNNYKNVYSFDNKYVTISTDSSHVIEFVPTPYCHFVGAFALYDRKNRILFTGDLFGGLSPANNLDLFATEEHWDGIKTFHQIYMPSKKAIQNAIDNIRSLSEPPLMIVPQHGSILVGDIMEQFMNRLYHLDVGIDLFNKGELNALIPTYLELMNQIFVKFSERVGIENLNKTFNFSNKNQELFYFVDIDENGIKGIFSSPEQALDLLMKTISKFNDYSIVNEIKSFAIKEALLRRLPIPSDIYSQLESIEEDNLSLFGEKEKEENLFS